MHRQKTVGMLACAAVLAVALGGVFLRAPTTLLAGLLLLGGPLLLPKARPLGGIATHAMT